ncbi:hypothetical protein TNCV_3581821 [Trichonephila clavipes]|nr:hypothetical protein TNCV_3581821 [Trichonephila clavipes]
MVETKWSARRVVRHLDRSDFTERCLHQCTTIHRSHNRGNDKGCPGIQHIVTPNLDPRHQGSSEVRSEAD